MSIRHQAKLLRSGIRPSYSDWWLLVGNLPVPRVVYFDLYAGNLCSVSKMCAQFNSASSILCRSSARKTIII